jgi:hypothetical protein
MVQINRSLKSLMQRQAARPASKYGPPLLLILLRLTTEETLLLVSTIGPERRQVCYLRWNVQATEAGGRVLVSQWYSLSVGFLSEIWESAIPTRDLQGHRGQM